MYKHVTLCIVTYIVHKKGSQKVGHFQLDSSHFTIRCLTKGAHPILFVMIFHTYIAGHSCSYCDNLYILNSKTSTRIEVQ